MKLKELVIAYRTLDEAKISTLNDDDAIKILKNRRSMRNHVESYNSMLKDAQEKFKPEGFDEVMSKYININSLSDDEKKSVNDVISSYQKKVNSACTPELQKEIDIQIEKISEDGTVKIAKENGWPIAKLDLIRIMCE